MTGNARRAGEGANISTAPAGFTRPALPPAAPPPAPEKSPEALRQAKHRAGLREKGLEEVTTLLGPRERQQLEEARHARGGVSGPYTVAEYLATLIRRDVALLEQELGRLDGVVCPGCRKPLPRGCGGLWASESTTCARAQADRALLL